MTNELNKIPKLLHGIIKALHSQTLMNALGLAAIRRIKERTRKGQDVEGRSFQPYTEKYAAKRRVEGLPTHPVNLEWNDIDGMLQKMDHTIFRNFSGVEVDFTDPDKRKLASYHNKLGVAKKGKNIRHFFDLNDDDIEAIAELIDDHTKLTIANLT